MLDVSYWNDSLHLNHTLLKYVSKGPIDNKSALVQVTSWRREGGKSLPASMCTQFIGECMGHLMFVNQLGTVKTKSVTWGPF